MTTGKSIKRLSFILALTASFFLSGGLYALSPINKTWPRGIAIKGYDPVAYFKQKKPVKGRSKFSYRWKGATWYFNSAENRNTFKNAPKKYAPQFGGYCAYAVAINSTANINPKAWDIVNGKLYLNYSKSIQKKWRGNRAKFLKDAYKNWPKLLKK